MAQYKVLQDIEAEDKFLGPLTLKQFIMGAIALVSCYLSFLFLTKGLWVIAIPFLPVIIVTGFLAFPWGRDQPTETWLLAKIRYHFKPRKRIWNQAGVQELVKITAPKKVQQYFSDNLSQNEVQSRLKALASTIDSRGWAVKNVNVNMYAEPRYGSMGEESSDRLVAGTSLPQVVQTTDIKASDDIFESPRAAQVASAIADTGNTYRSATKDTIRDAVESANSGANEQPVNYWFMDEPPAPNKNGAASFGAQTIQPQSDNSNGHSQSYASNSSSDVDENIISEELHARKHSMDTAFHNHRTINTTSNNDGQKVSIPPVTAHPDPVTIELAGNNDRVVSSLARESNKAHPVMPDDEVIISLH